MSDQRRQVLEMLAEGKIDADEAERLLAALERDTASPSDETPPDTSSRKKPKFLHVQVQEGPDNDNVSENVDIKIPIMLLKAGVKLGSVVPSSARNKFNARLIDKGLDIDLNHLDGKHLEDLIEALMETSIDVVSDKEKVRIFCS